MSKEFSRLARWGKSMYGGWYVNMWAAGGAYRWVGFHFDSLKECRAWAKSNGVALSADMREDN